MKALAKQSSRGWLARILRRFSARAEEIPPLEQSALQRARVDTSGWVSRAPITFGLLTTSGSAGAIALGAWLASTLPIGPQIAIAIGAGCVGFMAPVGALFMTEWVTALPRQRNEARHEIKRLTQPADVSELARDFSDWAVAKRASSPRHGFRRIPSIFDTDSEAWTNYEKRQDEIARLEAQARAEYHERFRADVVAVLGADAEDPEDIAALVELSEKLREIAQGARHGERIAAAQGSPVGGKQRDLLEALLEGVQLAVANDRAVDFSDAPDGEQQNREAFAAHFQSLMPTLETWHEAVDHIENTTQNVRNWIQQEVRRRGFIAPEYCDGTVAECFSEISVGRARRHELDDPWKIHLRCVQDITTEDGEKHWSAYLHSGRGEVKVAELTHAVEEFSEEGMAELNKAIAAMDDDLQACFDAIQRSDAAAQVATAQDALRALRQPLLDQLKRRRIISNPLFSACCPYCLAEIGL